MQKGFSLVLILLGFTIFAGLAFGGYYYFQQQKIKNISSFEECAKLYPVMESYPGQCNTPDGRHFVQQLSEEEKKKLTPPQNLDETANWETYKGQGFSFKYPQDLKITSQGQQVFWRASGYGGMILSWQTEPMGVIKVGSRLTVLDTQSAGTFDVEIADVGEVEKIKLGDKDAQGYSVGCLVDCGFHLVQFSQDGIQYRLIQDVAGGGLEGRFQMILSTFKFLDQNAEGRTCGGIAGNIPEFTCPDGYKCQLPEKTFDATGVCVKK